MKYTGTLLSIMLLMCFSHIDAHTLFASKQIENLAHKAVVRIPAASNDTTLEVSSKFRDLPVHIRFSNNTVNHIGVILFSEDELKSFPESLRNFAERYVLSLCLEDADKRKMKLEDDKVNVSGKLENVIASVGDKRTVRLETMDEKSYRFIWAYETKEIFSLCFPMDCELIFGMDKIELEEHFIAGLHKHTYCNSTIIGDIIDPVRLSDSLYFDFRSTLYLDNVRQGVFYGFGEDGYYIINDAGLPLPTIHNLLTEPSISMKYIADISLTKYGFGKERFTAPLGELIDFCMFAGCQPFVGFEESREASLYIAVLIMQNKQESYNHIFKFKFGGESIGKEGCVIQTEANVYVPVNGLRNIYDDNNQMRHIDGLNRIKL